MVRNHKKKSLYEAMSRACSKPGYNKDLELLHPENDVQQSQSTDQQSPGVGLSRWPSRARAVQANAGRIEISVPYQIAVAIILGVILLMVIMFRLGQVSSRKTAEPLGPGSTAVETAQAEPAEIKQVFEPPAEPVVEKVEIARPLTVNPAASNRIVIQTHQLRTDLEPVKVYFSRFGIKTEIRRIGDWYYLVTSQKYDNPEREGTDGYAARQKIVELGAGYRSPPGYGSFGIRPFHDAYGMKFDD